MEAQNVAPASVVAAEPQQGTPAVVAAATQAQPQPIVRNLDEDENFRRYKSTMDRQLAAQKAEAEALRRETEQLRQLAMRNLEPEEQAELRTRQLQGELERERQARMAIEMEASRRQALEDMSRTYGVPIEKLLDAETPADAYERILKEKTASQRTLEERLAQIEADIAAKKNAEAVTPVGIASLSSSSDAALQQRYNEAVWKGSSAASDRVRREAEAAGIKLDVMYPLKNRKRAS